MTPWPVFVRRSASMGALCLLAAVIAVMTIAFVLLVFQPEALDQLPDNNRARELERYNPQLVVVFIAFVVFVAPIVETLIFPLFYWIVSRFPGRRVAFIVVIAVIAFFAHGAAFINFAQAASFGMMAQYYDRLRREDSRPRAYWGVAIAHAFYNGAVSVVVAVGFFMQAIF